MDGVRLKRWLMSQGFDVHEETARRLLRRVVGIQFGKYDAVKRGWKGR